jgi:hypothetical protein
VLKNDSMIKEWYLKPPLNKIMKVYVFNYTNIDRFVAGLDKKLHVNEIGPLVYEEIVDKINVRYEEFTMTFNVSQVNKHTTTTVMKQCLPSSGKPIAHLSSGSDKSKLLRGQHRHGA